MAPKRTWKVIKCTVSDFGNKNVLKLSASLAFSTIFSLPGLLIIVIWVSNLFYRKEVVEGTLYGEIAKFVGQDTAASIQTTMRNSLVTSHSHFATMVGLASLIIGATGVFGEIQDSINRLWNLKAKPKGKGLIKFVLNRLLSFSMIISLGFILLVSLVINGAMDLLVNHLLKQFESVTVIVAYVINVGLTFLITALVFGLIFKILPDAKIQWKHVRVGGFATAFFLMAGKFLISYYLGHSTMSTAYGAAGSIIIILLWVYYSSAILYFGAIFTRQYAIETGSQIYPNNYAVWVEQVEVHSKKSLAENAQQS
ncbi:MAG TPA: YihY/virulence factor BrkB family protein [Chitinophagaceae bacterium]